MTWLKLTETALYLMDGGDFKMSIAVKADGKEFKVTDLSLLKVWLNGADAPNSLIVDIETGDVEPRKRATPTPEPEPQPEPGTREPAAKPAVTWVSGVPNQSSRNGVQIRRIINHYTTSENAQGSISWFKNPKARVSAHYVIARDGTIYQCVRDSEKAWHAGGDNADSIGIEHSAKTGQGMTPAQEKASIALQRYLMAEYKISSDRVTAHRFVPGGKATGTDCPSAIFGEKTETAMREWIAKHLA